MSHHSRGHFINVFLSAEIKIGVLLMLKIIPDNNIYINGRSLQAFGTFSLLGAKGTHQEKHFSHYFLASIYFIPFLVTTLTLLAVRWSHRLTERCRKNKTCCGERPSINSLSPALRQNSCLHLRPLRESRGDPLLLFLVSAPSPS